MSALAGSLPPSIQSFGFYLGATIAIVGIVGFFWHHVNEWQASRGRRMVTFEPVHLIAVGLLMAFAGVTWHILQTSSKLNDLQANFDKFLKPRDVTDAGVKAIEQFLLPRPPQKLTVVYAWPDSEAQEYAARIHKGIRLGGWDVQILSEDAADAEIGPLPEGLLIRVKYPKNWQAGSPKALELLKQALAEANIRAGSESGGQADVSEPKVFLGVGSKSRRGD